MRRIAPVAALLLAACGSDRPPPRSALQDLPPAAPQGSVTYGGPNQPGAPITAAFVPGYPPQIEVRIRDPQPAEAVALVTPDGRVLPAPRIETSRIYQGAGGDGSAPFLPGIGLGIWGGSGGHVGTGIGIGLPLGGIDYGPATEAVVSVARLSPDDPAAYRATWPRWTIRIQLGNPATILRKVEIAAPRPPEE
ncbi:MAG: hypothetical protein U1E53_35035 [Dongiaceae bacterium]